MDGRSGTVIILMLPVDNIVLQLRHCSVPADKMADKSLALCGSVKQVTVEWPGYAWRVRQNFGFSRKKSQAKGRNKKDPEIAMIFF